MQWNVPFVGRDFVPSCPSETPPRPNAVCSTCKALERHRFLWLFLTKLLTPPITVLGVSPDPISHRLKRMNEVRYLTVDQDAPATVQATVLALPFPDGAFDLVLCSHVLEHITDDLGAIKELLRVSTPTGTLLIMVPIRASLERTYEDSSVVDPTERARTFGQHDHVRIYGLDFPKRLRNTGGNGKRGSSLPNV